MNAGHSSGHRVHYTVYKENMMGPLFLQLLLYCCIFVFGRNDNYILDIFRPQILYPEMDTRTLYILCSNGQLSKERQLK